MRTLNIQRASAHRAQITAKITTTKEADVYLCNPIAELREAMAAGEPFEAHRVIGMNPKMLIVNPRYVVSVEEAN